MKASKILSLVLIPSVFGLSFGICSTISQKEDVGVAEQKALEVINTSTNMGFLLKAQKALEIRKYDLSNAKRDQVPIIMPAKRYKSKISDKRPPMEAPCCKCPKCCEIENSVKDFQQK